MDNSLENGASPDVSLRTKVLFASALTGLGLLLADKSAEDSTGQNGYNVFTGGTSGLVNRAVHNTNQKKLDGIAHMGQNGGY